MRSGNNVVALIYLAHLSNVMKIHSLVARSCYCYNSLSSFFLTFCHPSNWSNLAFFFLATCSDPGTPKHGRKIGSNFGHGHQVTFMCLSKYSLMGSRSMTCHDGKWSSVLPVCKGII